jgi:hypothetical protein
MVKQLNETTSDDRMLGKEDILYTYLLYMKRHGNSRGVLKRRLNALLLAYNPELPEDWEYYFVLGYLIDKESSEEKLRKIEDIIGRRMYDDLTSPPTDINTLRMGMFHSLLKYRLKMEEIRKTFDGVMECSVGFNFGIQFSQLVNKEILSIIKAKVDRVLLLLLGDKYDEKVSLSDLKKRHGYPSVSDEELRKMIINEMSD